MQRELGELLMHTAAVCCRPGASISPSDVFRWRKNPQFPQYVNEKYKEMDELHFSASRKARMLPEMIHERGTVRTRLKRSTRSEMDENLGH